MCVCLCVCVCVTDTIDKWDEEKLKEVVKKKHDEESKPKTDIVGTSSHLPIITSLHHPHLTSPPPSLSHLKMLLHTSVYTYQCMHLCNTSVYTYVTPVCTPV